MKALFILGLPDSKVVTVTGYSPGGELLYSWKGNAPFHKHWKGASESVFIVWHAEPERRFSRPDVIVNSMNDPDISGKSMEIALSMITRLQQEWPDVPVFNHPLQVMRTTREKIYKDYRGLPGLHMPAVARITPESAADVVSLANAAGVSFPFIIRPCGTHQAENLALVHNANEIKKLEAFAYDGRDFYVTAYVDCRDADGLYRKARLIMVGGEIQPRHCMTGENWLVSDVRRNYMVHHPELIAEEAHFVENWQKMIAPHALASLREIYTRSGLDYLGFDFNLRPNGELVIFEINPAQNVFLTQDAKIFPYMPIIRAKTIDALNRAIAGKVKDVVLGKSRLIGS